MVKVSNYCLGMNFLFWLDSEALAHGGHHVRPEQWWAAWTWPPLVLANLGLITILYVFGWTKLQRRYSHWKNTAKRQRHHRLRGWCFVASIVTLFLALVSPIDSLSEHLGWMHMIQHSLLMMVAAPLFILGSPGNVIVQLGPAPWRRNLWKLRRWSVKWKMPFYSISQPLVAWLLFALTLWVWHLPTLYELALNVNVVHDLQHLAFFLTAALFWQALLHPIRTRRLETGVGVLYLFLASIHSVALGVLMAISPVVLYPSYKETTVAFGFDPIQDQQLAGFIMWMPACMMYAAIAIVMFTAWLKEISAQNRRDLYVPRI